MPGRTTEAALDEFLGRLRRVASCVTDRPLNVTPRRRSASSHEIAFAPLNESVPLRSRTGQRRVSLDVNLECVVTGDTRRGPFDVRLVSYRYRVLDPNERELLAYHWHPIGRSNVTTPHLHLTSRVRPIDLGSGLDPVALAEMHLPTGPVRLADVVRLLIAEFDIAPRRPDWAAVLASGAP